MIWAIYLTVLALLLFLSADKRAGGVEGIRQDILFAISVLPSSDSPVIRGIRHSFTHCLDQLRRVPDNYKDESQGSSKNFGYWPVLYIDLSIKFIPRS